MRASSQGFGLSLLALLIAVAGSIAWNASSATVFVSTYASSLDESMEPSLARTIASAGLTRTYGRAVANVSSEKFTKYDASIIRLYTAAAYEGMNNMAEQLVDGQKGQKGLGLVAHADFPDYKLYNQLIKAVNKLPVYGNVVYRGSLSSRGTDLEARYKVGRVVKERRFTSTTKSMAVAEDFANGAYKPEFRNLLPEDRVIDPCLSTIITMKTLSGRDVTKYSAKPEEKEVLLPPGIHKIVEAKRDEKGRMVVFVVELDPAKLTDDEKAALADSEAERMKELAADNPELSPDKIAETVKLSNAIHERWEKKGYLAKEDLKESQFLEDGGGD